MPAPSPTIHPTRRPHRGGGFTLIELVAVMVIVAVIAASAVPALSSMSATRGSQAARQLLQDLTYARQRAVATGTPSWVVFDTAAETWTLLEEDPDNPGRTNAATLPDPVTGEDYTVTLGSGAFPGVGITSADFDSDVEIGFDWLGRPRNAAETDLAATGTVTLTSGHVVSVEIATGHVTLAGP